MTSLDIPHIEYAYEHSRFAISLDGTPNFLWVPDISKPAHWHIEMTWEGAKALRDWLTVAIQEHAE